MDRDLTTIEELIRVTPTAMRADMRRAAGRIAELGGWIAQDSGDPLKALELTTRAEDHLRSAGPALQAVVRMRRSNILLQSDPDLAVELADEAAQLVNGIAVGRLAGSIARQQALAAAANHDVQSFARSAARALDIAYVEPGSPARRLEPMTDDEGKSGFDMPPATTTDRSAASAPVALLPIGSFEQHGPYLPLVTDTLIATVISESISNQTTLFSSLRWRSDVRTNKPNFPAL